MHKTAAAVVGLAMLVGLTGCGDGGAHSKGAAPSKKDYCGVVAKLAGPHRAAPAKLDRLVHDASDVAPGQVASAWHDVADAVDSYLHTVRNRRLDPAHPPEGLDAARTRVLNRRLMTNAYLTDVGPVKRQIAAIRRDARSTCRTTPHL